MNIVRYGIFLTFLICSQILVGMEALKQKQQEIASSHLERVREEAERAKKQAQEEKERLLQEQLRKQGEEKKKAQPTEQEKVDRAKINELISNAAILQEKAMSNVFFTPKLKVTFEQLEDDLSQAKLEVTSAIQAFDKKYSIPFGEPDYNKLIRENLIKQAAKIAENSYTYRTVELNEDEKTALKSVIKFLKRKNDPLENIYTSHPLFDSSRQDTDKYIFYSNYYQFSKSAYEAEIKKWQAKLDALPK